MTTEKKTTVIPFEGFYETWAARMIDDEIEQAFDTDETGCNHNVPDALYCGPHAANYRGMYEAFAREYVEIFANVFENETGVKLEIEFESLVSPREYNFTTDRIFVFIAPAQVQALYDIVKDSPALADVIKENFTSRSGFASFYSNDIEDWKAKPLANWDHNEKSMLILAVMRHKGAEEEAFEIYTMMEDSRGNGVISNIVWDNLTPVMRAFAEYQREHGETDFEAWETMTDEKNAETARNAAARCAETPDMFNK